MGLALNITPCTVTFRASISSVEESLLLLILHMCSYHSGISSGLLGSMFG